ncbi:MAG: methionine synthase [Chloroflexi bacterium]|nr:methionine synthase [Chloroflexota bacterium]
MGTSLQVQELSAEDFGGKATEGCNDYLVLTRPSAVATVHRGFLEAGAEVLETCTFQSTRRRLAEWGLGNLTLELNRAAATLARRLADDFATPEAPRWVAGSMGPTGMLPGADDPTLSAITFDELAEQFEEQARGLVEGGVDLLLIETAQDILEVKAAIAGIRRYFKSSGRTVPIQAQITLDTTGRMLLGTDVLAALTILESLRVDVLGLNCSTGPEHMREPIRLLAERSSVPLSAVPNAGLPINVGGRAHYPLEPGPMARELREFVARFGVRAVGGCCGTTPAHIQALRDALRDVEPATLAPIHQPSFASPVRAVAMVQEPPPTLIGERVNTQGSRKMKRALLDDDYDAVIEVAREQVESGAHVLDVCVALTERSDEVEQMREVVRRLRSTVETPLMIDSTEVDVVKTALELYPGRAAINSINLERGRDRCDLVLPLAREHGAAVVALTIDEDGMAHTAERKLAIARRIYDLAVGEHSLEPGDLIFDVLTFPVTTGQEELADDAAATIEGIRRIKAELPGALTSLGVCNVSFGLSPRARAVLNSVFLHHCVQAGLDMAIVNPAHTLPYFEISVEERKLAEDLIANSDREALPRYIAHFERAGGQLGAAAGAEDPLEQLAPAERIHQQILHRKKDGIEAQIDLALQERTPVEVLNDILLPAMKDVGDRFGAGELILPYVLQSAEVMKRAVRHLEQFLEKKEGYSKGKVVLATVFGDVHDIGKSLVNTILTNNGYTVYDLGKQVPANTIVETALEVGADAIGLSALLVSTSKQMPLCVQELESRDLQIPVLIGGAAINRAFGRRAAILPDGEVYGGGVFYCRDAFEGLAVMDRLTSPDLRGPAIDEARRLAREPEPESASPSRRAGAPALPRSDIQPLVTPPAPPFWGARRVGDVQLADAWAVLDKNTLFRLHWGAFKAKGAEYDAIIRDEFEPRLAALQAESAREGWLQPLGVYGYFPGAADDDTLAVFDPANPARTLFRLPFPRQNARPFLCLSDYFRAIDEEPRDVVAFQAVTVGPRASEVSEQAERAGDYTHGYFLRGLAASTAEGLAEATMRRIRAELGLPADSGKRYSWGYGACPDLSQHAPVLQALDAERLIGLELTESFQLVPEHSTAALFVHHPQASYFMVRGG